MCEWHGMRGIATIPSYVIMQPTTLCNLDCCLLLSAVPRHRPADAGRGGARRSPRRSTTGRRCAPRFSVIWHGGEPLAAGREHLAALMAPFARRRAPHPDQRDADRRRLVRLLRRARHPGRRQHRRAAERRPRSGSTRGGRPAYDRDPARASTTLRGAASRSPRCVWSPIRGPAWPPSSTRSSATSAATRSASTSRSRRASTSAPTRTTGAAVRAFWAELTARLAGRSRDRAARDRVGAVVRRGHPRRHRRRAAAPPHRPDPDDRRTTAAWCCSRRSWPASPTPHYGDVRHRQRAATRRWPRSLERTAAEPDRLDRRVPDRRRGVPGRRARTSASAAAPTRPTGTSSTAGSTAPRPTTAATARSAYWRECWTMPEPTDDADPVDRARARRRARPRRRCSPRRRQTWRRARGAGDRDAGRAGAPFEDAFPTFYQFTNRPR